MVETVGCESGRRVCTANAFFSRHRPAISVPGDHAGRTVTVCVESCQARAAASQLGRRVASEETESIPLHSTNTCLGMRRCAQPSRQRAIEPARCVHATRPPPLDPLPPKCCSPSSRRAPLPVNLLTRHKGPGTRGQAGSTWRARPKSPRQWWGARGRGCQSAAKWSPSCTGQTQPRSVQFPRNPHASRTSASNPAPSRWRSPRCPPDGTAS